MKILTVRTLFLLLFIQSYAHAQVTWTGASSSSWAAAANWSTSTVPTSSDPVVIPGGTPNNPVVSGAASARSISITGGTLTVNGGALSVTGSTLDGFTIGYGASLDMVSGSLDLGPAGGGDRKLTINDGAALNVSGGTLTVNGMLLKNTLGKFIQSGGTIVLDGNSGTLSSSLPQGSHTLTLNHSYNTGVINCSAGTIIFVDPPNSSIPASGNFSPSSYTVYINSDSVLLTAFTGSHTMQFGDGTSTTPGNTDGFMINTMVNRVLPVQHVVVKAGSQAGRWVSSPVPWGYSAHIKGNLTIYSGSEFRNLANNPPNASLSIGGDLINDGTFTTGSSVHFGQYTDRTFPTSKGSYAVSNNQSISGSGVFRQTVSGATTDFGSVEIYNPLFLNTTNKVFSFQSLDNISAKVTANSNAIYCKGAVMGAGWVTGKLTRYVTASMSPSKVYFPVGEGSPVYTYIKFNSVTTPGDVTVTGTEGDHPLISTSCINPSRSVNRYWTITNNGLVAASMEPEFSIANAYDAGINFSLLRLQTLETGSSWTIYNASNLGNVVAVSNTTVTTYGDFIIGEYLAQAATVSITANTTNLACAGAGITFTATPVNGQDGYIAPVYVWKKNGVDQLVNSAVFNPPVSSLTAGDTIWCEMSSGKSCLAAPQVISNKLVLTQGVFTAGSISGGGTVCPGATSGLLTLSGYSGSILRWESAVSPFTSWTTISNTAATYTSDPLDRTTQFRAIIQSGSCVQASASVTVNIASGYVTGGKTVCPGSANNTLMLNSYTGTVLKWQSAVSPFTTWTDITNTTASYNPGVISQTTAYRAVVQTSCGNIPSDTTTIVLGPVTNRGAVTGTASACPGNAAGTLTLGGYAGTIQKWQFATAPFTSWKDINVVTPTLATPGLPQSTAFRAVVSGCAIFNSDSLMITVVPCTPGAPMITYFSPESGPVGTTVNINGVGFSSPATDNVVYFGAVKATVLSGTSTQLTVTVPPGATFEPITVGNANARMAYAAKPFNVTFTGDHIDALSFGDRQRYLTGTYPSAIAIGDLDGDGKPDLVTSNASGALASVLMNVGAPAAVSFAPAIHYSINTVNSPNYGYGSLAIGDLNVDGRKDIVAGGKGYAVFKNRGTVPLAFDTLIAPGSFSLSYVDANISDLDMDGRPDFTVSQYPGEWITVNRVGMYRNTATGTALSFGETTKSMPTESISMIALKQGDLNNDGKADLVTGTGFYTMQNASSSGTITFSDPVFRTAIINGGSPYIGDIDGDGNNDVVIAHRTAAQLAVFRSTTTMGVISFATALNVPTAEARSTVAFGDLNGDGKTDMAVSSASYLSVFENTGSPGNISFGNRVDYLLDASYSRTELEGNRVAIGDLDMDGKPDLALVSAGNTITVFRNKINEPLIASISPSCEAAGTTVTIKGIRFTGATAVSIGGVAASSFTVVSDSVITAVSAGNVTGEVKVTRPTGTGTFTIVFPNKTISGTQLTCAGTNGPALTLNGYTGEVLKWQSSVSPFTTWTDIADTNKTIQPGTITQATAFRAVMNSYCGIKNSDSTIINIIPATVKGMVTGGATICSGTTSGTLTLSGHTGTILKWQSAVSPFTSWTDITNTGNTYTSGALTQTTAFRAVVQSGSCLVLASDSTVVTVGNVTIAGTVTGGSTICPGAASGNLSLSGQTGTIQKWQSAVSPFTSWTDISNTAVTYNPGVLSQATAFRAVVQSGSCLPAASDSLVVNITAIVKGAVTGASSVCYNTGSGVLTLSGQTGTVSKWQSSVSPFTSWTNITNTATTYTSGALTQTTAFRAVITAGSCTVNADSTVVTVTPQALPGNLSGGVTICSGDNSGPITLSGNTDSIIKWQSAVSPYTTWTDIAETSSVFTSGPLTVNTQFRVVVRNGNCGTVTCSPVQIIVNARAVPGTITGAANVCTGSASGTLTLTGYVGTILRWQSAVAPFTSWTNITNTTSAYNPGVPAQTTAYRAVLSGCITLNSDSAVVTVNPLTVKGSVSGPGAICAGADAALTLAGQTGSVVKWQSAPAPFTTWTDITNTATTYTAAALSSTTAFRTIVKSGACAALKSDSVVVTVSGPVTNGSVAGTSSVCTGSNSGLLTLSGYTGSILKWQSAVAPFTSWTDIANTSTTYTSGALTQATAFRAVLSACAAYSDSFVVNVKVITVKGAVTGANTVCPGSPSGTLTLSGYTGSIVKWQSATAPFTSWTDIANTAATYTSGPLTQTTAFRAVVDGCTTLNSDSLKVTVSPTVKGMIQWDKFVSSGSTSGVLTLAGHTGAVQNWQYATAPFTSWTDIANTSTTYTSGPLTQATAFRAVVRNGSCATLFSDSAVVNIAATGPASTTWIGAVDSSWNDPGNWSAGIPGTSSSVTIGTGTYYPVLDIAAAINTLVINSGASLKVQNGTLGVTGTSGSGITINSGGMFTLNAGSVTLGPAGGGNYAFNANGALTVISGTMRINGSLTVSSSGSFTQSGGNIFIDACGATKAASISGDHCVIQNNGNSVNCTGGSIILVDPPTSWSNRSVKITSTALSLTSFTGTHTFIFGDGISTTWLDPTVGFIIENGGSAAMIPVNHVIVNGGSGRFTAPAPQTGAYAHLHIGGNLTINPGSDFLTNGTFNGYTVVSGDIINNGTFTIASQLYLGGYSIFSTSYAFSRNQEISGTGPFLIMSMQVWNPTTLNIGNSTLTISSSLTLAKSASRVITNNATLRMASAATLSSSAGGYVIGNLSMVYPTGTNVSRSYIMGTPAFPAGVTLTFPSVTTGGEVLISTHDLDHPQIGSSCIDSAKSVNAYWTLTNAGVLPAAYQFQPNWTAAGWDAGVNPAHFNLQHFDGTNWTPVNVISRNSGSITSTSSKPSGDFQVGETPAQTASVSIAADHTDLCAGDMVTFTATPVSGGSAPVYQWFKNGITAGGNGPVYQAAGFMAGDTVQCILTSSSLCVSATNVSSNKIGLFGTGTIAGALSGGATICSGSAATLTLTGYTGSINKWQSAVAPFTSWTDISNTSATYTSAPLTQTTRFRAVVQNGSCAATASSATTVLVDGPSAAGTITGNTPLCSGLSTTLTLTGYTGSVLGWESAVAPFTSWTELTDTTVSITTSAITQAMQYRAVVANGTCPSATSNPFTINVLANGTWTGASGSSWNNPANWCGGVPNASTNAVINAGTPHAPVIDVPALVNDINLGSGSSLSFTGTTNSLEIRGNMTYNGTFNTASGLVVFGGASAQTIPAINYDDLGFQGGGAKTLAGNISVSKTLALTNGKVLLGAYNLSIGSAAYISGASAASYIVTNGSGRLLQSNIGTAGRSGNILFPVGTAASYAPATINNSGTADQFSVRVIDTVYVNGTGGTPYTADAVSKTWFIGEATTGGSTVDLTLQWNAADELSGFSRIASRVSTYTGAFLAPWAWGTSGAAAGSDPYTRSQGSVPFSGSGIFAVGSGSGLSPLPVSFLSLDAQWQNGVPVLGWKTASEISNDHFDIERSLDGSSFEKAGEQQGAGNSSEVRSYSFTDRKAPASADVFYYRLKQVDLDGRFSYSNTVALSRAAFGRFGIVSVSPNPFSHVFTLNYVVPATAEARIEITDMFGKMIHHANLEAVKGMNSFTLPADVQLSSGVYFVRLTHNDEVKQVKVVKD